MRGTSHPPRAGYASNPAPYTRPIQRAQMDGRDACMAKRAACAHLHVIQGVLVGAVRLLALPIAQQRSADGHLRGVKLVQEAALVALHAEALEPVGAHSLHTHAYTNVNSQVYMHDMFLSQYVHTVCAHMCTRDCLRPGVHVSQAGMQDKVHFDAPQMQADIMLATASPG